ncbi:MAG: flavin reductase [Bacteroidota bacterium]
MRRPWNIINTPVYSLATYDETNVNMNICTYVMAVSRKPKLYAISIEHGSKTLENLENSSVGVLQLLTAMHSNLIRPLGLKSGKKVNKHQWLTKNAQLIEWQAQSVLKDAAAYLMLEKISQETVGDHELFIFKTIKSKTLSETGILMFQDLIDQKIILS